MNLLQQNTCVAIVNVFETGSPQGNYAAVTASSGGGGHLTYGRIPATLASGNLFLLLKEYCEAPEAYDAEEMRPYLPRLEAQDISLDHDAIFKSILRGAGEDPTMRRTQDDFFDKQFLQPAIAAAEAGRLTAPLSTAVVYDSFVQGGWSSIRDLVNQEIGPVSVRVPEEIWIVRYVLRRQDRLQGSSPILQTPASRTQALSALVAAHQWDLDLPLTVCGVGITEADLSNTWVAARPLPVITDGSPQHIDPPLTPSVPYAVGNVVIRLQEALTANGFSNSQDGIFGPYTQALVRRFQTLNHLPVDGVVGEETWTRLLHPFTAQTSSDEAQG